MDTEDPASHIDPEKLAELDLDMPVVVSRRDFFDNELSQFDDPGEPLPSYPEGADPIEDLKKMREEAEKRTGKGK